MILSRCLLCLGLFWNNYFRRMGQRFRYYLSERCRKCDEVFFDKDRVSVDGDK